MSGKIGLGAHGDLGVYSGSMQVSERTVSSGDGGETRG